MYNKQNNIGCWIYLVNIIAALFVVFNICIKLFGVSTMTWLQVFIPYIVCIIATYVILLIDFIIYDHTHRYR